MDRDLYELIKKLKYFLINYDKSIITHSAKQRNYLLTSQQISFNDGDYDKNSIDEIREYI